MSGIEKRLTEIEQKIDAVFDRYRHAGSFVASNDDVDLFELWRVVWKGKWLVIAYTFLFAVCSILYAISLPNIYKAEALLVPAEENSGGVAGMVGQFGGLAGLAGVNLGGVNDKTILAIEVLKSRRFISKFIQKHNLAVPLMAAVGWDETAEQLKISPDIFDVDNEMWVSELKTARPLGPSPQELFEMFSKNLSVVQDKKSNFVTIGFEFYSPEIVKKWIDLLVEDLNEEIKLREVNEAEKSIEYLTRQLEKTSISEMKIVFYELIEEQSKIMMFAQVRNEYVFKTIDEAVVPDRKSKPRRALICIFGMVLGGILGVFYVLCAHFLRVSK